MCPITHTKILVLIGTTIISFIFGFLWYGPIFGKTWAQLAGLYTEDCKNKKPPVSSLLLTLMGAFFTTFVMAYLIHNGHFCCNFSAGFLVWLGFYVPVQLGTVTWEGRPWKFFALNTIYAFLSLQIIAAVLTYWK